jgi:hypothetical protein
VKKTILSRALKYGEGRLWTQNRVRSVIFSVRSPVAAHRAEGSGVLELSKREYWEREGIFSAFFKKKLDRGNTTVLTYLL